MQIAHFTVKHTSWIKQTGHMITMCLKLLCVATNMLIVLANIFQMF